MMNRIIFIFILIISALSLFQCSPAGGNATGTEYMPDMVHSVAYEPNVNSYYYYHSWGTSAEIAKLSAPKFPVKGTIARGSISSSDSAHAAMYTGDLSINAIHTPVNGSVNYYYGNTEEERQRAFKEITVNKIKLTATGLSEGKLLYNIYCGICHGEKGDGAGYLVRDDGGKYPAQPANFLKDEFIAASEGRFYHGIMYGRNMMGAYSDKLSYHERWNVIHYIRSLQATSKNLKYTETENTFSGSQAVLDAAKLAAAATAPVVTVKK